MPTRLVLPALIAVLVAAGTSCSNGSSAANPPPPTPPTATRSSGPGVEITSYPVVTPVGVVATAGKAWVVSPGTGTVTAFSLADGARVRTVHVGATPLRAAYDGRLVWVTVFGSGRVVAIDPGSGRIVRRVAVPGQPEGIVAAAGSIWVVRQSARKLTEIHPDGRVGRSVPLGAEPRLVAAGRRGLFVPDFADGTVTRVNPRTGARAVSRRLCKGPQGLAEQAGTMWVACTTGDEVIAVDERTLEVLGRVKVGNEPDAVHADGSRLFVLSTDGPTLQQLAPKPASPTVLRSQRLADAAPLNDRANVDFQASNGRIWATSYGTGEVLALSWPPTG